VTGDLAALVAQIKPVVAKAAAAGADAAHLLDASIDLNAEQAAATLVRTSKIIRERVEAGELQIVVAIYDVVTGALELKAFRE
jgi:carbonic anhydrase